MPTGWDRDVLVVGAGLIGASVGLAAGAAGARVWLQDSDPRRVELAASLGAGRPSDAGTPTTVDLCVVAVPPRLTGALVTAELRRGIASTVTHTCSVQTLPQAEVETHSPEHVHRFVGSHPIAGRELSGPAHASADLFRDRPWVICPAPGTGPAAVRDVTELATACGAVPVVLDAATHDGLLARLSHAPQLVASALAATLVGLDRADAVLAGTGLRDTTRIADSDPDLWTEILTANRAAVADALETVAGDLHRVAGALRAGEGADERVRDLLSRGREGRALLPGKHGRLPARFAVVQVVIPDEPGALSDLLAAVAMQRVNVEDLRVEHAPGQPMGVAELAVAPDRCDALADTLRSAGWSVVSASAEAL